MQQENFEIIQNVKLAENIWLLRLSGNTSAITAPGQFVNLKLNGFYLRRPISVCDWEEGELTLIYKVLGRGTASMAALPNGTTLDLLVGLGNGYDLSKSGDDPLLVGGGVGIPPLYGLARRLVRNGKKPMTVLGYNTAREVFWADRFEALGIPVIVATADGSLGVKGFVTDGMAQAGMYSYLYTCGPEPMLKAVYDACSTSGQFSFEERMGCGFGACMGCSCETKYGAKRICRDGPVLEKEEILW
jgi:dihydroorotate dehydrogenase electron transfer subunit